MMAKSPCWRCLLLIGSLFVFTGVKAQYGALLHKTYAQRAPLLWKIGDSVFGQPDTTSAFRIAGGLAEFGKKNGDVALQLEGELYAICYLWGHFFSRNQERVHNALNGILGRAIRAKVLEVELKTRTVLANYYWWEGMHNYEQALEEYNKLDHLLESVSSEDYPEKIQILYLIGSAYFYFRDYNKSILYFRDVSRMEVQSDVNFQRFAYIHSFNMMTVAYQQLGKLDSSDHYLHLFYQHCARVMNTWSAHDISWKILDSTWLCIIKGDLGYNAYLRGRLEEAVPLLRICVDRGLVQHDAEIVAEYLPPLAEIYFKLNDRPAAFAAVLQAQKSVEKAGRYKWYRFLYPLLAKMYALQGKGELASQYVDSAVIVSDSLDRQFGGLVMARAMQKDVITSQKAELEAVRHSRQLVILKYYALLGLVAVLLAISVYVYRIKRLQHRQEQALKELQLKEAAVELRNARNQLYDFAAHTAEKNKLIEKMELQVGNARVLEELDKSVILTGADWRRFRELFEQVHPGWFHRLNEKVPAISPSEVRLLALARLNFTNKEMANMLGISSQAVRVTWHRLRKKLELPEAETLESLVNKI